MPRVSRTWTRSSRNIKTPAKTTKTSCANWCEPPIRKRLANDIVLKGFPTDKFEEHEVKQNVAASCATEYGFNDCYKFSRQIGFDKDTKEPRSIHIVTLSFISHLDKMRVFKNWKIKAIFYSPISSQHAPMIKKAKRYGLKTLQRLRMSCLKSHCYILRRRERLKVSQCTRDSIWSQWMMLEGGLLWTTSVNFYSFTVFFQHLIAREMRNVVVEVECQYTWWLIWSAKVTILK